MLLPFYESFLYKANFVAHSYYGLALILYSFLFCYLTVISCLNVLNSLFREIVPMFISASRRPAWTDRILHQVLTDAYENVKLSVQQTSYISHPLYTQSDHKPVTADYAIKVKSAVGIL